MNSMQSEKNKDEHLKKKNINSAEAGSQPSYQKRMNVLSKCYCHLVYELILSFSHVYFQFIFHKDTLSATM